MNYTSLGPREVLNFPLTGLRLIEASAGTGKTYTIANLYLRHILAGRAVGDILVVTFTETATDELRGRIRARLFDTLRLLEQGGKTRDEFLAALIQRLRKTSEVDQATRRVRLAVRSMDESGIFTIHGFCQRLLNEFAFNSGQPFDSEVLADDKAMWREAVNDWWRRSTYSLADRHAELVLASVGKRQDFIGLLQGLLDPQPRRLLPEVKSWQGVMDEFERLMGDQECLAEQWQRQREDILQILNHSPGLSRAKAKHYHPDRLADSLPSIDRFFTTVDAKLPPDTFITLTAGGIDGARLKSKSDPDLDHDFFRCCEDFWQRYEIIKRDLRVTALRSASESSRAQVRLAKQRARLLSFDDLLTETGRALRGETGEILAHAVRQRFPVALIDEFQDTDPVQYGIFRQLYLGQTECSLLMIGDPKQAIYSFRGSDIFAYMQAREDVGAESIYTLDTNWRSTPGIVGALNGLFTRREENAFVYGGSIPFVPARAADKAHRPLFRDGTRQAPLTLWMLPAGHNRDGKEKLLSKENARGLCHAAVAGEIAQLIKEGQNGKCLLGDDPVVPGDIAVLVRTSYEARALRQVLASRGVNAVSVERDGVFRTEEALDLDILLQAVIDPGNRRLVRRALAIPMLGRTYHEIEQAFLDEEEWAAKIEILLQLNETWQARGFMTMFQQMLRLMEIAEKVCRNTLPERRLTNLLHLGELLQQAAREHPGMDELRGWFRSRLDEPPGNEAELRLESDEELVKIATIHSSKGLQFPVVFVPYLWNCQPCIPGKGLLKFHLDGVSCLDAGSNEETRHLRLAEQERLAEDIRVAYVAMTRAESALYLAWGHAGKDATKTALAWLLHPQQSRQDLDEVTPDALADLPSLWPDVEKLAEGSSGLIRLAPIPEEVSSTAIKQQAASQPLAPRVFSGRVARDWRIASFSALTRDVHSGPPVSREHMEDDPAMQFPAGSHVGSYLHSLFEHIDFQGNVAQQALVHSQRVATRFDLDHERWGEAAARWLSRIVTTPLNDRGLALRKLSEQQRMNEMEFDFSTGRVDIERLNILLEQAAGLPLPPLEIETFRGMINGFIDLVFEFDGKFYIADYKSNFLGGRFSDYNPPELKKAVLQRRYDLQYLLYTLAVHRYLRQRLPDYDYARHIGGIFYLFLRGMHPHSGKSCGVYFDLPERSLVETLDVEVFGPATEKAA
jgi:exodeoxyribonuclease V beta subunit